MANRDQYDTTGSSSGKRRGGCLPMFIGGVVGLVLLIIIGVLIFRSGYNKAVSYEELVKTGWAEIDNQLQRRFDLIPNLVETVRGYATHESELFNNIAQARTEYFNAAGAGNRGQQVQAAGQLEGFLSRLLMLQENYPDLKANQNFLALQDQLEGTENRIAVSRTRYNQSVNQLNTYCRSFFGRFFCNYAGVEPAERFEISTEEAREAPTVDFGGNGNAPAAETPATSTE